MSNRSSRARDGYSEIGELRLIGNNAAVPPKNLARGLIEQILEEFAYRQTDDMTVIVARGR